MIGRWQGIILKTSSQDEKKSDFSRGKYKKYCRRLVEPQQRRHRHSSPKPNKLWAAFSHVQNHRAAAPIILLLKGSIAGLCDVCVQPFSNRCRYVAWVARCEHATPKHKKINPTRAQAQRLPLQVLPLLQSARQGHVGGLGKSRNKESKRPGGQTTRTMDGLFTAARRSAATA